MDSPYLRLIAELATFQPPLDRDGFEESLAMLHRLVSNISVRPRKRDLRVALEAICRATANVRLAELGLKTRF